MNTISAQSLLSKVYEPSPLEKFDPTVVRQEELDFLKKIDNAVIKNVDKDGKEVNEDFYKKLFILAYVTNKIDAPEMHHFLCKKIAWDVSNKEPEEIAKIFGVERDFTEAEIEQVMKENEWCEER